jgi:hypothetical protein
LDRAAAAPGQVAITLSDAALRDLEFIQQAQRDWFRTREHPDGSVQIRNVGVDGGVSELGAHGALEPSGAIRFPPVGVFFDPGAPKPGETTVSGDQIVFSGAKGRAARDGMWGAGTPPVGMRIPGMHFGSPKDVGLQVLLHTHLGPDAKDAVPSGGNGRGRGDIEGLVSRAESAPGEWFVSVVFAPESGMVTVMGVKAKGGAPRGLLRGPGEWDPATLGEAADALRAAVPEGSAVVFLHGSVQALAAGGVFNAL